MLSESFEQKLRLLELCVFSCLLFWGEGGAVGEGGGGGMGGPRAAGQEGAVGGKPSEVEVN